MNELEQNRLPIQDLPLWTKMRQKRALMAFDIELTARCSNNCRHCYINLPADDTSAEAREITRSEIDEISDEAVSLGALWCLLTGGEPLLRDDFPDIYLDLKRKGLLVSVFTNATLISEDHVELFKRYPPRDIEITVYGVTRSTYEEITRRPGSFDAFQRGVRLLKESGIKPRFKAMALRRNIGEMREISEFCRLETADFFRFDPFLHLRFDGNVHRNQEIRAERLTPAEVVRLEMSDDERSSALIRSCDKLIPPADLILATDKVFKCGVGEGSFVLGWDGHFRLCSALHHPECVYDLRSGSLQDAWWNFVPEVKNMRSDSTPYHENCSSCRLINLCYWCPAHAHLETGRLDEQIADFCDLAKARFSAIQE